MDLNNQVVIHKSFGEGKVVDHTGSYLVILFNQGEKKFIYPNAFKEYLRVKDEAIHTQVQNELAEIEQQKMLVQQETERKTAQERRTVIDERRPPQRKPKEKASPRANIAFKCNFCDGGKTPERIGFNGVCSDKMIQYNIGKAKHVWCSSTNSLCRKRFTGEIESYRELKERVHNDFNDFTCYESVMMRDWKASAGIVQSGENSGRPMRLVKVQANSLAVLTTRLPYDTDENRFIFAVFLVDESYEGDARDEGYVSTKSKYKIETTPEEAKKLKFWNYYFCPNAPEVIKFGSGLHRYLSDTQAAQILRDIVTIKQDTAQEGLAQEFFLHFCKVNGIDMMSIQANEGALIRSS